jgi:nucleotide-binding universal stress UspA family protein
LTALSCGHPGARDVGAPAGGPAAERLGDSRVPWDFQWRQGQIAHELIAVAESVQAAQPDDVVIIEVGSSSSAMHRMVGSVVVSLAHHSPVPVTIVP